MKKTIIGLALLTFLYACENKTSKLKYSIEGLKISELNRVEKNFRKKNLDGIDLIKDNLAGDYQAFYLDKRNVNGISLVTVYVTRDAFSIIFLLTFNNGTLISHKEIAGGICAGPEERNDFIYWCTESFAEFTNETEFYRTTIKKKSFDFNNSQMLIDTLTIYFSIEKDGTFKTINTDSIRVEKELDKYGKEK